MSVRIKICGITNLGDALVAARAGADYLGFILYEKSPRYVKPAAVQEILHGLSEAGHAIPGVGVFVNSAQAQIERILDATGLSYVQLHGDEPPEVVQALAPRAYKAIRPASLDEAMQAAQDYHTPTQNDGPHLLVDAYDPSLYGGTGKRTDEQVAAQLARSYENLLLSGGLTPANVAQAVADVRPWGVDVSSGVEIEPGRKAHIAVENFIAAVRGAQPSN